MAFARTLVNDPKALLLDQPSALDREQRRQMQLELKRIQRDVGITFVFVTHDPQEAHTISAGERAQTGSSRERCCALRDADGGDFVAYLEASRHDPAVRPGAILWLDWRSDAWRLLDPDAAPNAATPNVAKDRPVTGSLTAVRTRSTGYP